MKKYRIPALLLSLVLMLNLLALPAAMAAGAIAMESAETINPDMSARLLRRRAGFGEGVETP